MSVKVTNNAFGTLAANISTVQTVLTLAPGQGSRFPLLLPADWFWATLTNAANVIEIVKVTIANGDSMTVTRAQDNTVPFAFSAGDRFELRPCAALFNDKMGATDGDARYVLQTFANAAYLNVNAPAPIAGRIALKTVNPAIDFNDTSLPGANGLWEIVTTGGQFDILRNTDPNKLWATGTVPFSITQADVCQFGQRPTFAGFTPWDSGNFVPSAYLPLSGGTVAGPAAFNSTLTLNGTTNVPGTIAATGGAATGMSTGTGNLQGLLVQAPGAGAAFMAFHRPGSFATYVGLDVDNQFAIGGWSKGAARNVFWHDGNLTNNNQLSNGAGYLTTLNIAPPRLTGSNPDGGFGVASVNLEMVNPTTIRLVIAYMPNPAPLGGGH